VTVIGLAGGSRLHPVYGLDSILLSTGVYSVLRRFVLMYSVYSSFILLRLLDMHGGCAILVPRLIMSA
jgi:hypothetical protein